MELALLLLALKPNCIIIFFSVGLGLKVAQVCASLNKTNQGPIKNYSLLDNIQHRINSKEVDVISKLP